LHAPAVTAAAIINTARSRTMAAAYFMTLLLPVAVRHTCVPSRRQKRALIQRCT
jgi:hypothetical protein